MRLFEITQVCWANANDVIEVSRLIDGSVEISYRNGKKSTFSDVDTDFVKGVIRRWREAYGELPPVGPER